MGKFSPMSGPIESQQSEDSCALVWLAVAAHERLHLAVGDQQSPWWSGSSNSRAALSAISEIVSHAEVFVVESLTDHARLVTASSPAPIPKLMDAIVSKSVDSNWNERRQFIKTWLGPDLQAESWWKAWNGYVESRNAWAHGLGRLTPRQKKRCRGYIEHLRSRFGVQFH